MEGDPLIKHPKFLHGRHVHLERLHGGSELIVGDFARGLELADDLEGSEHFVDEGDAGLEGRVRARIHVGLR